MFAVIRTGGKQYKVAAGDVIRVEKLAGEPGATVRFGEVLAVGGEGPFQVGRPLIDGAAVVGEVVRQTRGEKIIILKKRRRKNYRRKKGHQQLLTAVKIVKIEARA